MGFESRLSWCQNSWPLHPDSLCSLTYIPQLVVGVFASALSWAAVCGHLSSQACKVLEDSLCINTYVPGTCSWLLLREAPVVVGDALGKDAEVTGWQADGRGPAGWECALLGAGL